MNEPFRRAALLAFAEDDEFFARTRLTVLALLAVLIQECANTDGARAASPVESSTRSMLLLLLRPTRAVYLLYWYKSTNTDGARAASQVEHADI